MSVVVYPVGQSAVLFRFGDRIDVDLSRRVAGLARMMLAPGILDLIPSYTTLLIRFDPTRITMDAIAQAVATAWDSETVRESGEPEREPIEIPVVYGGTHGPDLANVAGRAGMRQIEVIERHSNARYVVGAVGFSPGFGYLIGLPDELATPRLETPRLRVAAGSVGIGGSQTGVYPVETAGGWNLIGRTPLAMFDPARVNPFLLQSGDVVCFHPVESATFSTRLPARAMRQSLRGVEIVEPGLLTTIQDLGREGYGRFGLAPNGAADRTGLIAGNRLVGNADDAAGIEITLDGPRLRFLQATAIAITGEGPLPRLNGERIERNRAYRVYLGDEIDFEPIAAGAGARAYICVSGGFDVPVVMGSRATDLVAGIGGWEGRALRVGDRIPIGTPMNRTRTFHVSSTRLRKVIRVHPGPQREMFDDSTWSHLVNWEFVVSKDANRVGIRLDGPSLLPRDRADIISEGVVTGSIQVTGSGQPIVLLPGRATIGGYPKIATVIDDDLDLLGQLRPGDRARFRPSGKG